MAFLDDFFWFLGGGICVIIVVIIQDLQRKSGIKLDRVGPVKNRPQKDKLDFVKKIVDMTCNM